MWRFFFCWFIISMVTGPQTAWAQLPEFGDAVYYADYLHGRETAMGEYYDKRELTCAHKTHPLGALLKVTRLDNGRSVTVRVNDRGPYSAGCVVDLSWAAADIIGLTLDGKTRVRVERTGFSSANPPSPYQNRQTRKAIPQSYDTDSGFSPGQQVRWFPDYHTGYAIQIASYSGLDNAQRQVKAIQAQGVANIYLMQARAANGSTLYKIVQGPFTNRSIAEQQINALKYNYQLSGFVFMLR